MTQRPGTVNGNVLLCVSAFVNAAEHRDGDGGGSRGKGIIKRTVRQMKKKKKK